MNPISASVVTRSSSCASVSFSLEGHQSYQIQGLPYPVGPYFDLIFCQDPISKLSHRGRFQADLNSGRKGTSQSSTPSFCWGQWGVPPPSGPLPLYVTCQAYPCHRERHSLPWYPPASHRERNTGRNRCQGTLVRPHTHMNC